MDLRPNQQTAYDQVKSAWSEGNQNVMLVFPTGGGKTVIFSKILHDTNAPCCAIAHRQELVVQMSTALASYGVRHRIIGPKTVIRLAVESHMGKLGKSFYDPSAPCAAAGVDTLIRRQDELSGWARTVKLWVIDEAHHLLKGNKWGSAVQMFPNARGLGVTATPIRADRKGLGRHADGIIDKMVVGPNMRELINLGFLTDYKIYGPRSDVDYSGVAISKTTGDYNPIQADRAVLKSKIVGDVVEHYLKLARGKIGVTFATSIKCCEEITAKFIEAGVPAATVSAKTPEAERAAILKKLANRQLLQVVNVDLFGEGFDLPAIEVVSMARKTMSYSLFCQQFGRALRILKGKKVAIIIDHVGNLEYHATHYGLPDQPPIWTLDRGESGSRRPSEGVVPLTYCTSPDCLQPYLKMYPACPHCGFKPEPKERSAPEYIDGDLHELDPQALAALRSKVDKIDMSAEEYLAAARAKRMPTIGQMAAVKRHVQTQEAQEKLRNTIALWAGYQKYYGLKDQESYRLFFFRFGIDVLSAQALNAKNAEALNQKIQKEIPNHAH